jgi:arabinofuranan 3-O-arabinosyltransferase
LTSVAIVVACFAQAPGELIADTKLDLAVDPVRFLGSAFHLWEPLARFGYLQNQTVGYLFPMGPVFALGHVLSIPMWLVQRSWMALLLLVALWGATRLAKALGVGSPNTRVVAGAVYALSPWFVSQIGSTSAAVLPAALLPWVILPLVSGSREGSTRKAAALSGLAVLGMGATNAVATAAVLVLPALWLLTRQPSPRRRSLTGWWVVAAGLASAWWLLPLALQGRYGFDFLPYTESVRVTTSTLSTFEVLRGIGGWLAHLRLGEPWLPAGWALVAGSVPILATAALAAGGLVGLARQDLPERRFLALAMAVGAMLVAGGYAGVLGGLAGPVVRAALEAGPLTAFKNVQKFQPVLLLPLALGLGHAASVVRPRVAALGARTRPALAVALAVTVVAGASPFLTGDIAPRGSFDAIPGYWKEAAAFLNRSARGARVLILPADDHSEYVWGRPLEEPLQPLADIAWAERDLVPLGGVGSTRVLDAVERRLQDGVPSPGLSEFLARSGIRYVVARNDLDWRRSGAPRPLQVRDALVAAGLRRVIAFGPSPPPPQKSDSSLADFGISEVEARLPAVEIYQVEAAASLVNAYPVANGLTVNGGPDSLLQLADRDLLQGRAAVLAGDGAEAPAPGGGAVFSDAYRRRDMDFGYVHDNFSYTLAPNERPTVARRPLKQLALGREAERQSVARIEGARSVTASSYGSWLYQIPEQAPSNAFDGDPETSWVAANDQGSVGQWAQIDLEAPTTLSSVSVRLLADGPWRPVVRRVRVTTEAGSVSNAVSPGEEEQTLSVIPGPTRWVRLAFDEVGQEVRGFAGAGVRDVVIPGVRIRRVLQLPRAADGASQAPPMYAFERAAANPSSLLRSDEERRMSRRFSTPRATDVTAAGTAVARPGKALEEFLAAGRQLQVLASSSWSSLPRFRVANLVDGDATTSWIAQPPQLVADGATAAGVAPGSGPVDPRPVLRLSWPAPRTLDRLRIVAPTDFGATPERVHLSSPAGEREFDVAADGIVQFDPLTTDRVEVSFPRVAERVTGTMAGGARLPAGLAELDFPALRDLRKPIDPRSELRLSCGQGPTITVDGVPRPTLVEGLYADVIALRPLNLVPCRPEGGIATEAIALGAGDHALEVEPTAIFSPSSLTLTPPASDAAASASASASAKARGVTVKRWTSERRQLAVGAGEATYVAVRENFNRGWKASLDGKALKPVRLDGWQQGFVVPAGAAGTVDLRFGPAPLYRLLLGLGLVAVAVLVWLALSPGRRHAALSPAPAREGPGLVAWTVFAVTAVALLSWPLVLVVPPLIYVGRRRPEALPWIAGAAMLAAGVIVALQPGRSPASDTGAFGAPAQLLAVTAVAAVVAALATRAAPGNASSSAVDGT